MKIPAINSHPTTTALKTGVKPSFKANLWVEQSVQDVVRTNDSAFKKAAEMFDSWLRHDMKNIAKTVKIRKNSDLYPKVALQHVVEEYIFCYPEDSSPQYNKRFATEYEDLEFEMGNRKCGFWFDKRSNDAKLLDDFKNMFHYLNNGQ